MQLYMVEFDATTIIVLAETKEDLFDLLKEKDDHFQMESNKLFYHWGDTEFEECRIEIVDQNTQQILFSVSH